MSKSELLWLLVCMYYYLYTLKITDAVDFLRKYRESNQRKSAEILDLRDLVLSKINNLGAESKYKIINT